MIALNFYVVMTTPECRWSINFTSWDNLCAGGLRQRCW